MSTVNQSFSIQHFLFLTKYLVIHPATGSHPRYKLQADSLRAATTPWEEKLIGYYVTPWTPQGGQMLKGSEKQSCVSEPCDRGSDRRRTFFWLFFVVFLNKSTMSSDSNNSITSFTISSAKERGWMSGILAGERAKLPSCSQNFTLIQTDANWLRKKGAYWSWNDMVEEHTQCRFSPLKQTSTQGYRPDYVFYFLISASVPYVDLGYCFRPNIQRQEKQRWVKDWLLWEVYPTSGYIPA